MPFPTSCAASRERPPWTRRQLQGLRDGTYLDTGRFQAVFTATATASRKSVVNFAAGQTSGLAEPIQNPDGTVTFFDTCKGLPENLSIPGGPTLSRDAGVVTLTRTFREPPNGEFELVTQVVSGERGPHPELDSDFEKPSAGWFCPRVSVSIRS
jgi:hypothetical protein